MKKHDLIKALAEETGESQHVCARVLDALALVVPSALVANQSVGLPGLGKLGLKQLAARTLRTPQGQTLDVPARAAVKFTPIKALKEALATDEAV